MGSCRYCRKWVGFFGFAHSECAAREETEDAIRRQANSDRTAVDRAPKERSLDGILLARMLEVKTARAIRERADCFTVLVRGGQYPSNLGIAQCELYSLFAPRDSLKLVPEPDNPEDDCAIAVWGTDPLGQDLHLGYAPADFAASITHREIEKGVTPTAWVMRKHVSEYNGREMLIIQINLHPGGS
jgi:hypothetical protein